MSKLYAITAALCAAFVAHAACAQDDPRKEYLRLQATEFCSVVKPPPKALIDAVNGAAAQDPATWLPVIAWLNAIGERYVKLKCGDV